MHFNYFRHVCSVKDIPSVAHVSPPAMITTCVMLTLMHKRNRLESYNETRDYCYEQITSVSALVLGLASGQMCLTDVINVRFWLTDFVAASWRCSMVASLLIVAHKFPISIEYAGMAVWLPVLFFVFSRLPKRGIMHQLFCYSSFPSLL